MRIFASPVKTLSSVSFTDSKTSAKNWAGVAIGSAAASRKIIIVIGDQAGTQPTTWTIDGNTMTTLVSTPHLRIVGLAWPTGTTATIDISTSSSATLNGIVVYAVYGLNSLTPAFTATGTNPSTSITAVTGGLIIAGASTGTAAISLTGGVTQDVDLNPSGNNHFLGGKSYPSAGGSTSITMTNVGSSMAACSWSPYQ